MKTFLIGTAERPSRVATVLFLFGILMIAPTIGVTIASLFNDNEALNTSIIVFLLSWSGSWSIAFSLEGRRRKTFDVHDL